MKRLIITLLSIAILSITPTANAVELKVENGKQLLILTEVEYQSLNEDPYKLFSEIWVFEIGKKIPFDNLKEKYTFTPTIPADLVKGDPKIQEKMAMFNVVAKDYSFTVVVEDRETARLNIFTIGEDNICFSYRFETYRQGEVPVYRKDPILKLTDGYKKIIDIKLPSGDILKSVTTENYVQGLYVDRYNEIFPDIYSKISNDYELAMIRKAEEAERLAREEAARAEQARIEAEQRAREATIRAQQEAEQRAIEQAQENERIERLRAELKKKPVKSIDEGFRGIPWGIKKEEAIPIFGLYEHKLGKMMGAKLYGRQDENLSLGNIKLMALLYIFGVDAGATDDEKKGLMGALLQFDSKYFKQAIQEVKSMFGEPTLTGGLTGEWHLKTVKITMEMSFDNPVASIQIIRQFPEQQKQRGGGF